ncbi:MAG: ABC transporter ATP-binding protein [Ignisphaera sp.]
MLALFKSRSSEDSCDPVARVDDLWFRYGEEYVLKGISLQIRKRELVLVLGPNGSGKSTFLKVLAGILKPVRGYASLCGRDITSLSDADLARLVGYVHQNPWLYMFNSKVFDEISFVARNLGIDNSTITKNVLDIATKLDIIDLLDRSPFSLSEGEARRVVLASALIHKPPLLLLDEPTAGLDYGLKKRFIDIINKINNLLETAIVIATHDTDIITMLPKAKLLILNEGRIVFRGSIEDVLDNPSIFTKNNLVMPTEVELAQRLGIRWDRATDLDDLLLELDRLRKTLCR